MGRAKVTEAMQMTVVEPSRLHPATGDSFRRIVLPDSSAELLVSVVAATDPPVFAVWGLASDSGSPWDL